MWVYMANPEHVAVVLKGAAYIEEWSRKHPAEPFNLMNANLSGADLSQANLLEASLIEANLFQANLSGAILSGADLSKANLSKANLSKAKIVLATLYDTNLYGARLPEADMSMSMVIYAEFSEANLSGADLFSSTLKFTKLLQTNLSNIKLRFATLDNLDASKVNLTGATMDATTLGNCNLAHCVGLETVKHEGPSNIDVNTLIRSFRASGNCFTSELNTFFLNAGIPRELLETLPKVLADVKYCSSFVCYGQPDIKYARRIAKDLKARGVSCWLYSLDATPGKRTWGEITQMRREADKMIVRCSAEALIRDGVLKEIEEQIDEDREKIVPISLDYTWRERGFMVRRGERNLKPFLEERNYADFCVESTYEGSLKRLLKGLERTER